MQFQRVSPACRQAGQWFNVMPKAFSYFVYILKSRKDQRFYTGLTTNLEKRIEEHSNGDRATPSTLHRGPFDLMHAEATETLIEAVKLEKYFKSGSGREARNEIIENIWWL